jgi:hypothetical protein
MWANEKDTDNSRPTYVRDLITDKNEANSILSIIEGSLIKTNDITGLSWLTKNGKQIASSEGGLKRYIEKNKTQDIKPPIQVITGRTGFEPLNLFKVKNGILRILDRNKFEHGAYKAMTNTELHSAISLTQRTVDIETVTFTCEELKADEMVDLIAITENNRSYKSYFVTLKPKGHVFIGHGGYSESSSLKTQKIIKIIAKTIGTILISLLIAYLIFKLGWN